MVGVVRSLRPTRFRVDRCPWAHLFLGNRELWVTLSRMIPVGCDPGEVISKYPSNAPKIRPI
jgi:hypothetical protein